MLSRRLAVSSVGIRYLRLDGKVEGFARLSPSILREFLTYSVVGRADDPLSLARAAADLRAHIRSVSRAKFEIAGALVAATVARVGEQTVDEQCCVYLAGDVAYEMAHDVPRPERSTGHIVRGSDLDLVVVLDDAAPGWLQGRLDEEMYRQKYRCLINPSVREEIDYVVKPLSRLREQAEFDSLKKMVACKILQEGVFLYGSERLFESAKALLRERGITSRLREMEETAHERRRQAEQHLLTTRRRLLAGDELHLFFTADESEEFH